MAADPFALADPGKTASDPFALEDKTSAPAVAPPPQPSPLAAGWRQSTAGMRSAAGGLASMVGKGFGVRPLEDFGNDVTARAEEDSAANTMRVEDVKSVGGVVDFAQYALGNLMPYALMNVVLGMGGRGLAAASTKNVAHAATREFIKDAGTIAGPAAFNVGIEAGSIYPDAKKTGVDSPIARSILGGVVAGSLDTAFPAYLMGKVFGNPAAKAARGFGVRAMLDNAGKDALKSAAIEGSTEGAQTFVERAAAGQPLNDAEATSAYLNSAAVGAVGGGVVGGAVGGAVTPLNQPSAAPVNDPFAPATNTAPAAPPVQNGPASPSNEGVGAGGAAAVGQNLTTAEPLPDIAKRAMKSEFPQIDPVKLEPATLWGRIDEVQAKVGDLDTKIAALKTEAAADTRPRGRTKQKIASEINAVQAERSSLGQRLRNLDTLASLPDYQKKTGSVDNGVLLSAAQEQQSAIVTPGKSGVEAVTNPKPGFTRSATDLVEQAKIKERAAELYVPFGGKTRESVKAPDLKVAQEQFLERAGRVAETSVKSLVSQGIVPAEASKTTQTIIYKSVKDALNAPSADVAKDTIRAGVEKAVSRKLLKQDVDNFVDNVFAGLAGEKASAAAISVEPPVSTAPPDAVQPAPVSTENVQAPEAVQAPAADPFAPAEPQAVERPAVLVLGKVGHTPLHTEPLAVRANAAGGYDLFQGGYAVQDFNTAENITYPPEMSTADIVKDVKARSKDLFGNKLRFYEDKGGKQFNSQAGVNEHLRGIVAGTQERFTDQGRLVVEALGKMLGSTKRLEVVAKPVGPNEPAGRITLRPQKDTIAVATNAKDVLSVAYHEGFHYIEERILDGSERAIMNRGFTPGTPLFERVLSRAKQYDYENKTDIASEIASKPEEAHAYGFEMWKRGELKVKGLIAKSFEKIREFVERLTNVLHGSGFTSVLDIYKAIDAGEYANRNPQDRTSDKYGFFSLASTAFKEWFGNSKVVEKNGKPLVVYHGSPETGITAFDPERTGQASDAGYFGRGVYFAENARQASTYTKDVGVTYPVYLAIKNPFVWKMPLADRLREGMRIFGTKALLPNAAYARTSYGNNLFGLIFTDGSLPPEIHTAVLKRAGVTESEARKYGAVVARKNGMTPEEAVQKGAAVMGKVGVALREELEARGYDGIVVDNPKADGQRNREFVVFKPEQIKSATGNVGTYDPANPNILESRAAVVDMAQLMADGQLQPQQLMAESSKFFDGLDLPKPTVKQVLGISRDSIGGSLKRFYLENIASGTFIARDSRGFGNVFGVLTAHKQRKDFLISQGVDDMLSKWDGRRGATQQDIQAVGTALFQRTEGAFKPGSAEYQSLLQSLTTSQREMLEQANKMIADRLQQEFIADQRAMGSLLGADSPQYAEWFSKRQTKVAQLIEEGYVPERRYGDHVVHVTVQVKDAQGNAKPLTLLREQFETEAEARARLAQYSQALEGDPAFAPAYEYKYAAQHDGSLSYQQFLDMARRQGIELTQAERERMARAMVNSDSVRNNRIFRRSNVPGYSRDTYRVLSEFAVTMANKIAYSEFSDAINSAAQGAEVSAVVKQGVPSVNVNRDVNLWATDGEYAGFYRNLADQRIDFVMQRDPGGDWSRNARAAASMYFLGGSFAAGAVQLSSLPMNTVPYLYQHTGYTNAFGKVLAALRTTTGSFNVLRDIAKLKDTTNQIADVDAVPGLRQALIEAAQDGTVLDTEIYHIMGTTRGGMLSKSPRVQKAMEAWMAPFRLAEQMNRFTTFIAAYKVGVENNLAGDALYKFAQETVYNTQFRYDEANRPGLAQNPIWAILFTFKSYPIFMSEMVVAMFRQNPRAGVAMLLSLSVASGVNGLPFADDLMDLVDTIAQRLFGSPFNSKRAIRNTLKAASEAIVGADVSGLVMNGMVNEFTGLSFASRVGLGNMIPGTRVLAADADYKRSVEEIVGPVASMVGGAVQGGIALTKGEPLEALRHATPLAMQNVFKSVEQFTKGYASDSAGRKLIDVNSWDAFVQGVGFSSAKLAEAYDLDRIDRQTQAFYKEAQKDFTHGIVKAVQSGEPAKINEAYQGVLAWNAAHPDMPMVLSGPTLRGQIAEAGMPLNQRTLKMLPRALRSQSMAMEVASQR